ncbi:fumarylacetoacetate hydrolase family protein [Streptomyces lacrimifluminis]|uniref:fumarylacetoacetate hydrolase family protein n=1 Tax=Streptomyces lacrimifluminis TaxID=1500077 RepID=UPI00166C8439|nr:fumarylacetoacetate hydrolase family protein [Streptomyces lacrimifluminis]
MRGPASVTRSGRDAVSSAVTPPPGDLITTGTPAGTGNGRERAVPPPSGTRVISVIRGVGELRNALVRPGPQ